MSEWTWPAYVGIFGGLGVFMVAFLPILALQYRQYGRFTIGRLLGAAAVSVYLVALAAYTLLPLPSTHDGWCTAAGSPLQVVPFHFLSDIAEDTRGLGTVATLTSRATLQVVFNVVLFIPFGALLRGYLGRSVLVTTALGFAASVLIESTQYTGIWGLYGCAYRVADIDDVITNGLGALIGALIAPALLWWMPQRAALAATRGTPRKVTVWRRWMGMAVDYVLFSMVGTAAVLAYRVLFFAFTNGYPSDTDPIQVTMRTLVPAFLVFVLPALGVGGASIGQRALWLTWVDGPADQPRQIRGAAGVLRSLSSASGYALLLWWGGLDVPIVSELASNAAGFLLVLIILWPLFSRDRRGLSGTICGVQMRDEREFAPRRQTGA